MVSLQLVPEGPVTLFPGHWPSSRAGICIYLYLFEQLPHLVSCGQASYLKNIRDWEPRNHLVPTTLTLHPWGCLTSQGGLLGCGGRDLPSPGHGLPSCCCHPCCSGSSSRWWQWPPLAL